MQAAGLNCRVMRVLFSSRATAAITYILGAALLAGAVWWVAFTSALDQLEERGRTGLALSADRLSAQLLRYRELAVFLAEHPVLHSVVTDPSQDVAFAVQVLQEMADMTGSTKIRLLDRNGVTLAAVGSAQDPGGSLPAFRRAMNGALGATYYVDGNGRRVYTFAAPIFATGGRVSGAVLATIDIRQIEWNWPSDPSPVFFTDRVGQVFVTNRSDLIPSTGTAGSEFPPHQSRLIGSHDLWLIEGWRYLPRRSLHLTQPMPIIGMTGEILIDISPVRRIAFLLAAATAALCLALGALLFLAAERRRALAEKLEAEAASNTALEARVRARTAELSSANNSLLSEVHEREDAEAALRKAQADLVQAGKLSALGQMSAGISHELNQPLMAIRSFAENAETLLARGRVGDVEANLSRISELARRMGRIIKNLRAFSRQETETLTSVDLGAVVDAVLELAETRLAEKQVTVVWDRPVDTVLVRGGEVRLQQVVMNLISNGIEAMEESTPRRLEISIDRRGAMINLLVRDTGPGITDPGKIFDPFYSTKEVGKSEGMGLGLSISYGLVQSFGGVIRGQNHGDGGAIFTVALSPAEMKETA